MRPVFTPSHPLRQPVQPSPTAIDPTPDLSVAAAAAQDQPSSNGPAREAPPSGANATRAESGIRFSFMRLAMPVLGLGLLAGPERALAARPVGIDVSDYQSVSLNWNTLKNTYGIVFGWAKCSEGTCAGACGGANFTTYAANAKAAGVLIGAYHYARYDLNTGTAGATSEANAFWSIAGPYIKGGGYYIQPMLDVEASFTGYTKTTLSQWVNQWCITVSNSAAAAGVPGVKPCIYCSSSHASAYLDSTVTQWNADIADWAWAPGNHAGALAGAQAAAYPPAGIAPWSPSSNWQFWQYDDQNAAQAYTTGDGDIFNGTMAQLIATMVIGGGAPGITNQPASQTVVAGADATFSVGVSGTPPFSYQWRFNGTNIPGGTVSSYTRYSVQAVHAGSYSVVVANAGGSTNSANAVLTVHAPPTITVQPSSRVMGLGQNLSLSVTATGDTPLSYQWQYNGTNLASATASTLAIVHMQMTNAGTYAVVLTNTYGTTTSSNALVTVLDPYILNQPQSQTVPGGAPATFSVGAVGTAPLSYFWSKDGAALTNGGNISGAGTPTLALASAQVVDVGTYSVMVSNVNGTMGSSNATLLAAFAPLIAVQPPNQRVLAGSLVSLSPGLAGPGPMTNQWRKEGTNLVNAGHISGATAATLSVSNVQAGDMGNYSVAVTNAYGGATSSNALLTVWPLLGWGRDDYGQADILGGLSNVTSIAAGVFHGLALRADGTVGAWGAGATNSGVSPHYGQALVPGGLSNVTAIAAGSYHNLAVCADGTVVAWGAGATNSGVNPNYGQAIVPGGLSNVVAVAGGGYHSLALKADGTVVAWGAGGTNSGISPDYGQSVVPGGLSNVVAVAAGAYHNLALKADGTVVAWGYNTSGQTNVPAGLANVAAVAAGNTHSLALRADGTVVAWGSSSFGQTNVPSGLTDVVAVAGGIFHSLALQADGTIAAWGRSTYGQTNIPAGLGNGVRIAGGGYHNLILESDGRPSLTVQPVSQVAAAGTTVRLLAMAVGVQPLSYQWQSNGTNLAGATASALTLPSVQYSDAGGYALVVSNVAGTVASSTALLTVLSAPFISAQPTDQSVVAGAAVTFTVGAAGSNPLGYQWQFNSAAIAGATQSAYNLASVQSTNAGTYSAVVSNAYGVAVSSNAVLTLLSPPSIITQPSNQTVVAGASVSFTVQAASDTAVNYQWYLGQTNVLGGENGAMLSMDNVQPAQAGDYTVVVGNVAGSVTSAVATLTVLIPPAINTQPAGQTVNAGSPVTFTVSAASSLPLGYQWQFNTAPIAGATQSSYSLLSAQPADAGSYSVVLTNAAGSVTSTAAPLTVLLPAPPIMLSAPSYGANGVFQFNVVGAAGSNYVIEASTNLTDWLPLETNTSPFTFADTNAVNVPLQFYRAQPWP